MQNCFHYIEYWNRVGYLGCFKDKDVLAGPSIGCSTINKFKLYISTLLFSHFLILLFLQSFVSVIQNLTNVLPVLVSVVILGY